MTALRLLSWNILHGGGTRSANIVEAIAGHQPDIVALQEFRHGASKPVIMEGLRAAGLEYIEAPPTATARENTLLLASRFPVEVSEFPAGHQGLLHAIEATVDVGGDLALKIISVHFPQKKAQIPLFEALLELPVEWLNEDSLLIGDFNCGIPLVDSQTQTFYATQMFQQMLRNGWSDAWRCRNPQAREYSWISTRKGNGFRYDHALASPALDNAITSIHYDHSVREEKYSDHSLLLVDVEL